MNKFNSSKDYSFENNNTKEENLDNSERNRKSEKVLCNHCGRTKTNGIRCLGICVSDNEY